jgi:hypothetical protein
VVLNNESEQTDRGNKMRWKRYEQHWTGPVLHEPETPSPAQGAAATKTAMEAAVKKASLENMVLGGWY